MVESCSHGDHEVTREGTRRVAVPIQQGHLCAGLACPSVSCGAHALLPGCPGRGLGQQAPQPTAVVICTQVCSADVGATPLMSVGGVNRCLAVAAALGMAGGGNVDGYRLVTVV